VNSLDHGVAIAMIFFVLNNWLIDEFVLIVVDCDNSFQVGMLVLGSHLLPLAC
jgi:hypothetical protein